MFASTASHTKRLLVVLVSSDNLNIRIDTFQFSNVLIVGFAVLLNGNPLSAFRAALTREKVVRPHLKDVAAFLTTNRDLDIALYVGTKRLDIRVDLV